MAPCLRAPFRIWFFGPFRRRQRRPLPRVRTRFIRMRVAIATELIVIVRAASAQSSTGPAPAVTELSIRNADLSPGETTTNPPAELAEINAGRWRVCSTRVCGIRFRLRPDRARHHRTEERRLAARGRLVTSRVTRSALEILNCRDMTGREVT